MVLIFLSFLLAARFLAPAAADAFRRDVSSIRCGTELVEVGDPEVKVLEHCGEPDLVRPLEDETSRRTPVEPFEDRERTPQPVEPPADREFATVEEWVYNFGPNEFMRYLKFREGELVRIELGGYGY
jgi:hypothetical protein